MSKVCERSIVQINCAKKDEVKAIMSELREKGYRTSESIHWSETRQKFSVKMYTEYKKLILN